MKDWSLASLSEAVDAISQERVTSRELVEACLGRIERAGRRLNCFLEVDPERARAAADRVDSEIRSGRRRHPLAGIPLAHKDLFVRHGRIPSCGSRVDLGLSGDVDATAIARLEDAGAIGLGWLAMCEFALGPHGANANFPTCHNAWRAGVMPGGSSSGSGVAVAARLVFGSLGTDTGGSIRCPAAVNGVVGLKPTQGRVSRAGVLPLSASFDTIGPFGRTVRDVARLLHLIAGPDGIDGSAATGPVPDYVACLEAQGPLPRIGVAKGYFDDNLEAGIADRIRDAVSRFAERGLSVRDVRMPSSLSEAAQLHPVILKSEAAAIHLRALRKCPELYQPDVRERIEGGIYILAQDYINALRLRGVIARDFVDAVFSDIDVIVAPVLSRAAPLLDEVRPDRGGDSAATIAALTRNTRIINFLGLPALSVPCGFDRNGVPVGIQLIGKPFAEAEILRAGHQFQQATDWHRHAPSAAA